MELEFTQISETGRARPGNEDYLGYIAPLPAEGARGCGWLFALADGVGGSDLGEVASRTAIECMMAGFRLARSGESHTRLLAALIRRANTSVLEAAHEQGPQISSMATTIVACAMRQDRLVVGHVGDSRCYLIRRGEARLLTRDHTLAAEQIRLGLLTPKEAAESDSRHILTRSLGVALAVNAEVNEYQLFAGDVLVLCSDGLHDSVSSPEIAAVTGWGGNLEGAARRLADLANQRDGNDNISLQIVRVRSVQRVDLYPGRPYRLP